MEIKRDDLTQPQIALLINEHLADIHATSPAESIDALDLDALRQPNLTFWSAMNESQLLGCGALKRLSPTHGEIKSMRTDRQYLRRDVAANMLQQIIPNSNSM